MREKTSRVQTSPVWKRNMPKKGGFMQVDNSFKETIRWNLPLDALPFIEVLSFPEQHAVLEIRYGTGPDGPCHIELRSKSDITTHMNVLSRVEGFSELPQYSEIMDYLFARFGEFKATLDIQAVLGNAGIVGGMKLGKALHEHTALINLYNVKPGITCDFALNTKTSRYHVDAISGERGSLVLAQVLSSTEPDKRGWTVENPPYNHTMEEADICSFEKTVSSWYIGLDTYTRNMGFYVLPSPGSVYRAKRLVDIFFGAEKLDKGIGSKHAQFMQQLQKLMF